MHASFCTFAIIPFHFRWGRHIYGLCLPNSATQTKTDVNKKSRWINSWMNVYTIQTQKTLQSSHLTLELMQISIFPQIYSYFCQPTVCCSLFCCCACRHNALIKLCWLLLLQLSFIMFSISRTSPPRHKPPVSSASIIIIIITPHSLLLNSMFPSGIRAYTQNFNAVQYIIA